MKTQHNIQDLVEIALKTSGDKPVRDRLEQLIHRSVCDGRLWPLLLESSIVQTDPDTVQLLSKCDISKPHKSADFCSLPKECQTFPSVVAYYTGFVWNEELSVAEINKILSGQSLEPAELTKKTQVFVRERESTARTMITLIVSPIAVIDLFPKLNSLLKEIRKKARTTQGTKKMSKEQCSLHDIRFITSVECALYEGFCEFVSPNFNWEYHRQDGGLGYDDWYTYGGATGGHWKLTLTPFKTEDVEIGKINPEKIVVNNNLILPCPT
jgi:hypothetical protein